MTVTVDLPPGVERAYLSEAWAKGVPVDDLMREVLIAGQPALPSAKPGHRLRGNGCTSLFLIPTSSPSWGIHVY
jgi:hypothetical protein